MRVPVTSLSFKFLSTNMSCLEWCLPSRAEGVRHLDYPGKMLHINVVEMRVSFPSPPGTLRLTSRRKLAVMSRQFLVKEIVFWTEANLVYLRDRFILGRLPHQTSWIARNGLLWWNGLYPPEHVKIFTNMGNSHIRYFCIQLREISHSLSFLCCIP